MRYVSFGLASALLATAAAAQPPAAALRPTAERLRDQALAGSQAGPSTRIKSADYPNVAPTSPRKPFRIKDFERLPPDTREDAARKIVERMFPVGSAVKPFEDYFSSPKNKCSRGYDPRPYFSCYFTVPAFSLVSTEWTIGCYTDNTGLQIEELIVARNLTGL